MGLYSCAIGGCDEKTYRRSTGVKFFYLKNIKDETTLKAWKDRILSTRSDIKHRWEIKDVAICSRHFPDGDKRNMPTIIPKKVGNQQIWPVVSERRSVVRKLPYSTPMSSCSHDEIQGHNMDLNQGSTCAESPPLKTKLSALISSMDKTPPKEVISVYNGYSLLFIKYRSM